MSDGGADRHWIPSEVLLDDLPTLAATVEATKEPRAIERDDLAVSYFVIGYASRVATAAVGAWIRTGAGLDVSPERTAVALTGPKPTHFRVRPAELLPPARSGGRLHAVLIDGHLALLVERARQVCRVSERLLWGNVGSACAYAFEVAASQRTLRPELIRGRARRFFASARPEVACSGRLTPVGRGWMWERNTCCGWHLAPEGSNCADCSLLGSEQHRARSATVEVGHGA